MAGYVADVMTCNVVAVRQIAEFKDIVEVMHRRRVSAFPVIDADNRVIGVVSEADLLPREAYPHRPAAYPRERRRRVPAKAEAFTASELMTSPPITITADATVADAAKMMYSNRVKRLPVVDEDGRLIGIVSRVDLLGIYDRSDAEICEEITDEVIAGEFVLDSSEFTVAVSRGVVTITGRVERQEVALSLLQAVWDVCGVIDVRDRLTYPVKQRRDLRS
jgi:CBS-domain-containing membrane protein